MEYTKDMVLQVNYGQANRGRKVNYFSKLANIVARHKIFTTIISITLMLIVLDFMLITSFIQVLGNL